MNLTCYRSNGNPLFARDVKDQHEAKLIIMNHMYAVHVSWIIYKGKKFLWNEVLKWK